MESRKKIFWIILGCMQAIGIWCASLANVHIHPLAFLGAWVLLLPGNLLAGGLLPLVPGFVDCLNHNELGCVLTWAVVSAVLNVALWYGLWTAVARRRARKQAKSSANG